MTSGRRIRCYDYVNRPYEQVREALNKNAPAVFQSATGAAASRARSIASELRIELGGIAVEASILISVTNVEERPQGELTNPMTRLQLEWQAAKMPGLFPFMKAELAIYPLTSQETQLDFSGVYEPPLGAVGKALNAIAGRRIAEVSVHRFIEDVGAYLRTTLPAGAS